MKLPAFIYDFLHFNNFISFCIFFSPFCIQMKMPLECPFHPLREIFAPQQAAKTQNRRNQWTCNLCGKSFFEEKFLDMHFDARHSSIINTAEDAICLANFCDIMRCRVLLSKDATLSFGEPTISTDIEIWNEATAYRTAMSASGPRSLAKIPHRNFIPSILRPNSAADDEQADVDPNAEQIDIDECNGDETCAKHCDNTNGCVKMDKNGANNGKTNGKRNDFGKFTQNKSISVYCFPFLLRQESMSQMPNVITTIIQATKMMATQPVRAMKQLSIHHCHLWTKRNNESLSFSA